MTEAGPGVRDGAPSPRPPVALGCTAMAAFVAVLGVFLFAAIGFLESGSDGGWTRLEEAASYGPGTVEFVGEHNIFAVRLGDGEFLALSDLDAANRASPGRHCRVAPVPTNDPALPGLVDEYRARMSPDASGSTLIFRESCNNALYDFTGVRLDQDGRNLDRYTTSVRDGDLAVSLGKRQCTARQGSTLAAPVPC